MPLADALSERLGLPSNGSAQSAARRDKNAMSEALRAAGLRAAEALKTADAERGGRLGGASAAAPPSWSNRSTAPAPTGSASATTRPRSRPPSPRSSAGPTPCTAPTRSCWSRSCCEGTQLFVNSISWDGVHHVSEVWRDNKLRAGANFIYDYEELLPRHGEQQDQVVPYVEAVLDALGIRFGPAHTEVMLTATGPVLVESGARMHGSVPDEIVDRCTPSHQTLTAEAYLDPKSVARRAQQPYELAAGAYCVMLISQHEGRIVDDAGMREIEALPSFAGTISMLGPGDQLKKTIDLFSCPGIIYLVDPDRDRLKADYDRIRELDAQAPSSSSSSSSLPKAGRGTRVSRRACAGCGGLPAAAGRRPRAAPASAPRPCRRAAWPRRAPLRRACGRRGATRSRGSGPAPRSSS